MGEARLPPWVQDRETALLLLCARTQQEAPVLDRLRAHIAAGLDWERFCRLSEQHAVVPLCYHSLQRVADAVPPAVLQWLRATVQQFTWHGLLLLGELCKLTALFAAHGVDLLSFKGPTLSALAYGDPVLRFSGDLDILVPDAQIPVARQLLLDAGYITHHTEAVQQAPERAVRKVYHHEVFVHPQTGVAVELHWKVDECAFIRPFDPLFVGDTRTALPLGGATLQTLAREPLLLLLCDHGAKHRWWQLRWVCDIAEFIRRHPALSWPTLEAMARRSGNARVLALGLLLAHDLLESPVPDALYRAAAADRHVVALADEACACLGMRCDPAEAQVEAWLFHIKAKERLRDRVHLLTHFTLIPGEADWSMVKLPPALSFLYTIIRPLRLLRRVGPRHPV